MNFKILNKSQVFLLAMSLLSVTPLLASGRDAADPTRTSRRALRDITSQFLQQAEVEAGVVPFAGFSAQLQGMNEEERAQRLEIFTRMRSNGFVDLAVDPDPILHALLNVPSANLSSLESLLNELMPNPDQRWNFGPSMSALITALGTLDPNEVSSAREVMSTRFGLPNSFISLISRSQNPRATVSWLADEESVTAAQSLMQLVIVPAGAIHSLVGLAPSHMDRVAGVIREISPTGVALALQSEQLEALLGFGTEELDEFRGSVQRGVEAGESRVAVINHLLPGAATPAGW